MRIIRSQEREDEDGDEFLYIAPPRPSKNWKAPSKVRWTNFALIALMLAVSAFIVWASFNIGRAVMELWR